MQDNRTELSVSTEVLEKMAELAALEVEGVEALSKRSIDLKGSIKSKTAFKGVKVENVNGAIDINVYICVKRSASVREVAEAVQANVKDKIQTMTGTAVTRVNVNVQDIKIEQEEAAQ